MSRGNAGLAVGAFVSAACIVASSPGGPLPWLMPWSLVPFFLRVGDVGIFGRVAASFFVAGAWAFPIAAALVFRAPVVGMLLAAAPAGVLAGCLLAASSLRLHNWKRLMLFAALWAASGASLQFFAGDIPAWPLSGGIALAFPVSWPVIALGGWPLLDLLLLSFAAIVWGGVSQRASPGSLVLAAGAGLLLAWLSSYATDRISKHGVVRVGIVQGDLPWSTLRTVGLSPRSRAVVRERIFRLTRRAIEMRAEVVVWPENGTGSPVGQIRADATAIAEMARQAGTIILAAGDELGSGGPHAVVWLFDGHGIDVLRKASHVPGVEIGDDHERAPVSNAGHTTLGMLLCFDSVIRSNVARAVESGAEVLVAPSDNSSFSATALSVWQIAASLVLAVEQGRALVVVMNRGPSLVASPMDGTISLLVPERISASAVVEVPRTRGSTLASRGGTAATVLVALLLVGALLRHSLAARDVRCLRQASRVDASRLAGHSARALAAACLGLGAGGVVRGVTTAVVERRLPLGDGSDPGPAMRSAVMGAGRDFRQSTPNGCGPAALAWVLFSLGDTVFEERLSAGDHRHSLADLSDIASQRGFLAQTFRGRVANLSDAPDTGYVLHTNDDHFLGAFRRDDGDVVAFDPADGSVRVMRDDELAASWSGYGVELVLPRVASGF